MPKEYTPEQLWQLYEKLPKELQKAIWAEETAENIANICERNRVPKDKIPEIAKFVGNVLIGILPVENFQKTLEEELKLEKELTKRISQEINNLIFEPLKENLEKIYGNQFLTEKQKPTTPEKTYPKGQDIYREPI